LQSLSQLEKSGPTANDWIVALTDGEDNGSGYSDSVQAVKKALARSHVKVVVIGVGQDVQTEVNEST
jgi:Mg-chelatase subunit ChlD